MKKQIPDRETTYSVKEIIKEFRSDVNESFDIVTDRLEKIDDKQGVANGRTAKLENSKIQIWTVIGVLLVVGSTLAAVGLYALKASIKDTVAQALKDNAQVIYAN